MIDRLDQQFKQGINKEFTTPDRGFPSEAGADTLNIHAREVWSDTIASDPDQAVTDGVAVKHTLLVLDPDPVFGTKSFRTTGYTDFIPDKYGIDYKVKLYDNNDNQIFESEQISGIEWFFDYKTGILSINNPGAYTTPYKITAYRYVGTKGVGSPDTADSIDDGDEKLIDVDFIKKNTNDLVSLPFVNTDDDISLIPKYLLRPNLVIQGASDYYKVASEVENVNSPNPYIWQGPTSSDGVTYTFSKPGIGSATNHINPLENGFTFIAKHTVDSVLSKFTIEMDFFDDDELDYLTGKFEFTKTSVIYTREETPGNYDPPVIIHEFSNPEETLLFNKIKFELYEELPGNPGTLWNCRILYNDEIILDDVNYRIYVDSQALILSKFSIRDSAIYFPQNGTDPKLKGELIVSEFRDDSGDPATVGQDLEGIVFSFWSVALPYDTDSGNTVTLGEINGISGNPEVNFQNAELIKFTGAVGSPDSGDYSDGAIFDLESTENISNTIKLLNELIRNSSPSSIQEFNSSLTLLPNIIDKFSHYNGKQPSGKDPLFYAVYAPGAEVNYYYTSGPRFYYKLEPFLCGYLGQDVDDEYVVEKKWFGDSTWSEHGSLTISGSESENIWRVQEFLSDISSLPEHGTSNIGGYFRIKNKTKDITSQEVYFILQGDNQSPAVPSYSVQPTLTEESPVVTYLSGVPYYGQGSSFRVNGTVNDLFDPLYVDNHLEIIGNIDFTENPDMWENFNPFIDNDLSLDTIPAYNESYSINKVIELDDDLYDIREIPYRTQKTELRLAAYKPGRFFAGSENLYPNVSNLIELDYYINTFSQDSTDLIEYFHDENYRVKNVSGDAWISSDSLTNQDTIVVPEAMGVTGLMPEYSGPIGSNYFRKFISDKNSSTGKIKVRFFETVGSLDQVRKWVGVDSQSWRIKFSKGYDRDLWYDPVANFGDLDSGVFEVGDIYGCRISDITQDDTLKEITLSWTLPNATNEVFNIGDVMLIHFDQINGQNTAAITKIEVIFE
jgi:hypothetical protein